MVWCYEMAVGNLELTAIAWTKLLSKDMKMITSTSKRRILVAIIGILAACLFTLGFTTALEVASPASGDPEFNQIREKARSGKDLSLRELKILADPYRSPFYANVSVAEKDLVVRHNNNPDAFQLTISVNPDTAMAESVTATPRIESRSAKLNNPRKTA